MDVREILILLHRQHLSERGVAARDAANEQLNEIAHDDAIELLPRPDALERLLREQQRRFVRRIERATRPVRPFARLPSRVERNDLAEAHVRDAARCETRLDRVTARLSI